MPIKIALKIIHGDGAVEEVVFDGRATCIIGRNEDCGIQLPDDEAHRKISRHHCLLDINPPDIRVRDFGSLNGTYVNGARIGQRGGLQTREEAAYMVFPEYDLKDGDEIRLGDTLLRIRILAPLVCVVCFAEIPEELEGESSLARGDYLCDNCRGKTQTAAVTRSLKQPKPCTRCGRDASTEIGEYRQGQILCAACKADPSKIVNDLLVASGGGDESLQAIEGYEIIRELGRGGMGAVYLARHSRRRNLVALKVMIPEVATDEYSKESFLREAENSRALRHPNVVQVQDWGFSNGIFFFTLEYCDGGSVHGLMENAGGTLSIDKASGIVLQALDGLEYAHNAPIPYVKLKDGGFGQGNGLVHRDLKPANILLSNLGNSPIAKVADYGLAKAFDMAGLSGQTLTGARRGTVGFMPRQQILNFKYVGPEVDVWAMAATFYNMLTGYFPRDFPQNSDVAKVVLQSAPVPIRSRDASIPRRLADAIDLALVERPEIHFKTAVELKNALLLAL
jgi:hypothetical protein